MRKLGLLPLLLLASLLAACAARGDFGIGGQNYTSAQQTLAVANATYAAADARYQMALATARAEAEQEREFMDEVETAVGQWLLVGMIALAVLFIGATMILVFLTPFARQWMIRDTHYLNTEELPALHRENHQAQLALARRQPIVVPPPSTPPAYAPSPGQVSIVSGSYVEYDGGQSTAVAPEDSQVTQPGMRTSPLPRLNDRDNPDNYLTRPNTVPE